MTLSDFDKNADKRKGNITGETIKIMKFEEKRFLFYFIFCKSYLNYGIVSNAVF